MEDAAIWAHRTFATAVLGDARRTKRLVRVGAMMASNPGAGIPEQAMLGGFLARKVDSEPGWQSLWSGWRELLLLYAGYLIAREENCG